MKRVAMLALAGMVCAGSAHAELIKRKLLLESCGGANEKDCTGYLVGIADAAMAEGHEVCVPAEVKIPAMKAKVLGWLKAHKSEPNAPAAPWVRDALKAAYPCNK